MKKRLILMASLVFAFACLFALTVGAKCAECEERWTVETGSEGYLGEMTATNSCPVCGYVTSTEKIAPLFLTKGYSYSEEGSITQHYAVNREAIARYEAITGDTVLFGGVAATRNHIASGPIDKNGKPVSDKVSSADFTNTEYDLFDVIVREIPESYKAQTEIVCCAYVVVDGKVTYIDNGVQTSKDKAYTFEAVKVIVDNGIVATPVAEKQGWEDDGSLKILTIGNSYSDDAMEYVYNVAKSLGVENVEVANLRANSCSLATHLSNAQKDTGYYMFRYWGDGADRWTDYGSWSSNGTYKISTAVTQADWDYIIFQQVSTSSTNADSYDDLNYLIDEVQKLNATAKYGWHMTWGYKSTTDLSMYNNIVNAVKSKIVTNDDIDVIIPNGTAIQNARTSTFVSLDDIMRNNHLGYGLGRYTAALTMVKKLTGLSIDEIEYVPTADTEGHTFNFSLIEKGVAIESANNAFANPFEVTNSVVDERYGLIEVDYLGLVKYAYYNSTVADYNYEQLSSEKVSQSAGVNEYQHYFSTKMFSKEMLPVGSVITIADGWTYRPEGWVDSETVNTERPAEVTEEIVVVTEEWWGNDTVKAFNIRKNGTGASTDWLVKYKVADIEAIFKIYVPENAVSANAQGSSVEPQPDAPAFAPKEPIINEDGLVKKSAINESKTYTYNGKTYYALSLETMGYSTGFYNSTSGTWLSTAQTSWAGTRLFTRDELLVGMLIWSDVNYRPEGWFDLDDTNPRNDNVSGVKEIDENWWYTQFLNSGNVVHDTPYVARGFNWQKGSNPPSAMYDHFVIYVPEDMIAAE